MQEQVGKIVKRIARWAIDYPLILAAALVGSQARGTAHAQSDIDLMLLTEQPLLFKTSIDWLNEIDWGDRRIESWKDKDYGAVWSRHVHLNTSDAGYTEVELSFGQMNWASIDPLDPGTRRVVRDGCYVLYDSEEKLTRLLRFVSEQS